MRLGDIDVYILENRWVDQKIFEAPGFYDQLVEKVTHLAQHPDYPAYLQRAPLNFIRRIRMGDVRIYARVHIRAKTLVVLALVGRGQVKRDETGGALDYDFVAYLQSNGFDPIPPSAKLLQPPATPAAKAEPAAPPTDAPLSDEEALALLSDTKPTRGRYVDVQLTPFAEHCASLAEKAIPGDRVIIPLPAGVDGLDRSKVRAIQTDIHKALTFYGFKDWSVRFDDISLKLLLVPHSRVYAYCTSPKGVTRPQEVITMSEQTPIPPEAIVPPAPPTPPAEEPKKEAHRITADFAKRMWEERRKDPVAMEEYRRKMREGHAKRRKKMGETLTKNEKLSAAARAYWRNVDPQRKEAFAKKMEKAAKKSWESRRKKPGILSRFLGIFK